MKKFVNVLKWIGAGLLTLVVGIALLVLLIAATQTGVDKLSEQAYAEGQVDAINNDISFVRLVTSADTDTEKTRKIAYAQGLEDAFDCDIRVKAVTDSTYVWTKSPWDKESKIPTDIILIKK